MQRIVFLFLLISQCAFGQFFVVKDKDGYVNIRVELTAQKYDKKKHTFTKENKGDHYEYKIDGKPFEGTDGSEPETEYKSFVVSINGKQVNIPKSAYRDMYVPAFSETSVYYDKEDDIIYIEAQNGTGAGGYDVCWQIVKGVYKTREVGHFN